jgi:hypothetical protein
LLRPQQAALQLHDAVQFAKSASSAMSTPGGHWAIHDIEQQVQWFTIFGCAEAGCTSELQISLPR